MALTPTTTRLQENNAANVEWNPLYVDDPFLIQKCSLGLGSHCLLLMSRISNTFYVIHRSLMQVPGILKGENGRETGSVFFACGGVTMIIVFIISMIILILAKLAKIINCQNNVCCGVWSLVLSPGEKSCSRSGEVHFPVRNHRKCQGLDA